MLEQRILFSLSPGPTVLLYCLGVDSGSSSVPAHKAGKPSACLVPRLFLLSFQSMFFSFWQSARSLVVASPSRVCNVLPFVYNNVLQSSGGGFPITVRVLFTHHEYLILICVSSFSKFQRRSDALVPRVSGLFPWNESMIRKSVKLSVI